MSTKLALVRAGLYAEVRCLSSALARLVFGFEDSLPASSALLAADADCATTETLVGDVLLSRFTTVAVVVVVGEGSGCTGIKATPDDESRTIGSILMASGRAREWMDDVRLGGREASDGDASGEIFSSPGFREDFRDWLGVDGSEVGETDERACGERRRLRLFCCCLREDIFSICSTIARSLRSSRDNAAKNRQTRT